MKNWISIKNLIIDISIYKSYVYLLIKSPIFYKKYLPLLSIKINIYIYIFILRINFNDLYCNSFDNKNYF